MKISDIIKKSNVYADLKSGSKRNLLQELAQKAAVETGINERSIFDALLERENLGTTGFGGGTALPHARLENLDKIYGFFAKLEKFVWRANSKKANKRRLLVCSKIKNRPQKRDRF